MITRKTVHFNLPNDLHAKFRISAFENGVTMQEIFRMLVERYVDDEKISASIIKRVRQRREDQDAKELDLRLGKMDTSAIYDLIEESSTQPEKF